MRPIYRLVTAVSISLLFLIFIPSMLNLGSSTEAAPSQMTRDDTTNEYRSIRGEIDMGEYLNGVIYGSYGGSPYGYGLGQDIAAGDVDGDGYQDIIASSTPKDTPGAANIIFAEGPEGVFGQVDLKGNNDIVQLGSSEQLAVGDLNGDEYDDIITAVQSFKGVGTVSIYLGRSRANWSTGVGPDFSFGGPSGMGCSLDVGDFDGDGIDDVLVGCMGMKSGADVIGGAYLISTNGSIHKETTFYGPADNSWTGQGCAMGDINNDGFADIVIGTPRVDGGSVPNSGSISIVLGRPGGLPSAIALKTLANLTIFGEDSGDRFGGAISCGDVDNDGYEDILVGAPGGNGRSNERDDAGEAVLIFGTDNPNLGLGKWGTAQQPVGIDVFSGSVSIKRIYGSDDEDEMGMNLFLNDMDGDDHNDMIIGTIWGDGRDNKRDEAGEAFAIYGRARSELPSVFDRASDNLDAIFTGGYDYDLMGNCYISERGADGTCYLLLAATQADGPDGERRNCGEGYLFRLLPFMNKGMEIVNGYDLKEHVSEGGTTCFAQYKDDYVFRHKIWSAQGPSDVSDLIMTIDPEGLNITIDVNLSGAHPLITEYNDPDDLVAHNIQDLKTEAQPNGVLYIDIPLKFSWAFPTEDLLDVTVRIINASGIRITDPFESCMRVENDLDLEGEYYLNAASSGNASMNGSWIRPYEPIQLHGLKVVYQGSLDRVPPKDDYGVTLSTSRGSRWVIPTLTNGNVAYEFNVDVPSENDARVTHDIDIIDIGMPGGMAVTEDVSDIDWVLRVDGTGPTIMDIELPEGSTVIDGVAYVHEDHANITFGSIFEQSYVGGDSETRYGAHIPYDTLGVRDVWATTGTVFDKSNASHYRTPGGLVGRYYDAPNCDQLSFVRTDPTIDFDLSDWGVWGPNDVMNLDWFSVRWTGYLYANYSSTYNIYITADNDARLYLDDELVYEQWDQGGSGHIPIFLEKGFHPIRLDYRERMGVAQCILEWQVSVLEREVIPSYNLFHTGNTVTIEDLTDGQNTVQLWAEDWLGNIGPVESFELLIDTNAPTIEAGFDAATWHNSSSPVLPMMLYDTDSMINPSSLEFNVDEGGWLEGWSGNVSPIQTTDLSKGYAGLVSPAGLGTGTHTLGLRCQDRAQNPSAKYSFNFKVDVTSPEVMSDHDGTVWDKDFGTVNVTVYDSHSAMANGSLMYRRKNPGSAVYGPWIEIDDYLFESMMDTRYRFTVIDLWLLDDGITSIQIGARDSVGNLNTSLVIPVLVQVPPRNYRPIAVLAAPTPNGTFISSEPVFFSAAGSWDPNPDDNASLSYTWYEDGITTFSSGLQFNESLLPGNYTFMLEVSDGRLKTEVWFWILVLSPADYHYQFDGSDWDEDADGENPIDDMDQTQRLILVMALLLVLLLLVLTFVMMYMYSRKKGKQTSMAVGSSVAQEDDETLDDEGWLDQRAQVASSVTEDDLDEEATKLYGTKKKAKKKKSRKLDPSSELEPPEDQMALPPSSEEFELDDDEEDDMIFDDIGDGDEGDDLFDDDLDDDYPFEDIEL